MRILSKRRSIDVIIDVLLPVAGVASPRALRGDIIDSIIVTVSYQRQALSEKKKKKKKGKERKSYHQYRQKEYLSYLHNVERKKIDLIVNRIINQVISEKEKRHKISVSSSMISIGKKEKKKKKEIIIVIIDVINRNFEKEHWW